MYGLFVKRHAEAAALKHHISVFYVHAVDNLPVTYEIEVKKGFINEYFCYYKKASSGIKLINTFINLLRFLRGHLKLWKKISKPDLIHVHILTRLGVLAYLAYRIKHIPYVITEHWSRYQKGNRGYEGWFRQYLTRLVTRNAAAYTTVTMNLKQAMDDHRILNKNHYVLNNVVDTKIFFPATKPNIHVQKKKFVHVSCFDDEPKNISGLINCINELAKRRTDFHLDMVGNGKDFEKMVDKARELKLLDTFIFFKGELEGVPLGNMVRNADILLLFSNYENLPVVINEAFCCGVPVLSTDVGGIKEVVNESNGKLVAKGDVNDFVNQLEFMMDHPEIYDQKTIHQNATGQFSNVAVSETLDKIYTAYSFT